MCIAVACIMQVQSLLKTMIYYMPCLATARPFPSKIARRPPFTLLAVLWPTSPVSYSKKRIILTSVWSIAKQSYCSMLAQRKYALFKREWFYFGSVIFFGQCKFQATTTYYIAMDPSIDYQQSITYQQCSYISYAGSFGFLAPNTTYVHSKRSCNILCNINIIGEDKTCFF